MSDRDMSDGEKVFLGLVIFLVLKGLLDPKDAGDKDRVRKTWKRVQEGDPPDVGPTLWESMKPW